MTDRYAVIGNPIGHTKSPLIHGFFAEQTGQDMEYTAFEAPIGGFASKIDEFRRSGGLGLNITAPFKLDAFDYATELSQRAKLAGAVNAMKFSGDRVVAENFDGVGLTNDIQLNLKFPMKLRRVLLLGAGGAARGAILPFLEQLPGELIIVNRTISKAQGLVERFSPYGTLRAVGYEALAGLGPFDLVINATSASLRGELPPVPAESFAPGCLAYELAYGKGLTPFLRVAREAGAGPIADGVGMLVEQAAEAFEWWRGIRPATLPMIEKITVPLT
jgi:shikimate dehydrogenase